jgi:hypothetical protein
LISIQTNLLPNSIRTIYHFSKWLTDTSTRPKSTTTTTTTTVGDSGGIGGSVVVVVVVVAAATAGAAAATAAAAVAVAVAVAAAVLSTVQFISHQTFRSLVLFHSFAGVTSFLHSSVKAYYNVQKSIRWWASY